MTDKDKKAFTSSFDRLPNKEAEKHFNQKSLITSVEFANFKAYQHALAFTVAGLTDKDMLTEIHKAVKSAIDNGTSFNDFKKSLKPFLVSKGWLAPELTGDKKTDKELLKDYETYVNRRLKTIYRTNKSTAYAAGRWERLQRTKERFPYLQYMKTKSAKYPRDEHKAYYGIVRPVDDPIWQSIFPPNGFGCKCWVKPLTTDEAREIGISTDDEVAGLPVPDFDSNFDRLGGLLRLAEDKHGAEFAELLRKKSDDFMVDLIFQPDFTKGMPTVLDKGFEQRFDELYKKVKEKDGNRKNSMELRKELARGDVWAVATLSTKIQQELGTTTAIIWLSDDTMVKMMAHHPELELLELFKDTAYILKNAVKIVKTDELNVVYFSVGEKYYKVAIKATKDKSELYLLTIFKMYEKDFNKELNKIK